MRMLFYGLLGVLLSAPAWAKKVDYQTSGACGGLPRIDVSTPAGFCVGLVAKDFKFPRGVQALPDGRVLVVDMGGWARRKGSLWLLNASGIPRTRLLNGLDEPHDVKLGPDGKIYVSELTRIIRFSLSALGSGSEIHFEVVARNLPDTGRHPLHSFVFGKDGALYVDFGSATDHCERAKGVAPDPTQPCAEAEGADGAPVRGGIERFDLDPATGNYGAGKLFARGLRNSVALAVHPTSGLLIQGENSRDFIDRADPKLDDAELPHDELNVISESGDYGWPYCYDRQQASPEYPGHDCSKSRAPALLIPAHTAPLGMTFYQGKLFPADYQGKLLVTYHGYRDYGHRLVAVSTAPDGAPSEGSSKSYDLIWNWDRSDSHPMGAPVELSVAPDGSVFITEDKNGTLLRLTYDPTQGDGALRASVFARKAAVDEGEVARCKSLAGRQDLFSQVQRKIIDTSCVRCHGNPAEFAGGLLLQKCDDVANARRLLEKHGEREALVRPCALSSELMARLKGGTPGMPQMPVGAPLESAQLSLVNDWIMRGAPPPGVKPSRAACPVKN